MKIFFFEKLLFLAFTKKLKINFFKIMIILKNLLKYVKSVFFSKKVISFAKNSHPNDPMSL